MARPVILYVVVAPTAEDSPQQRNYHKDEDHGGRPVHRITQPVYAVSLGTRGVMH
jgi:hypothetical protein